MNADPSPAHLHQEGLKAFRSGAFEEALGLFQHWAKLEPRSAMALYYLGLSLNTVGEWNEALKRLDSAIRIEPRAHVAYIQKAVALIGLKQFSAALSATEKALGIRPGDAEATVVKTRILLAMNRLSEAAQAIVPVTSTSPQDVTVLAVAADVLSRHGRASEAAKLYAKGRFLAPTQPDLVAARALVLARRGHHEEAAQLCHEALAMASDCFNAMNVMGFALSGLLRFDEAAEAYKKAVSLNPNHAEAWCGLGQALLSEFRAEEGKYAFRRALELEPGLIPAVVNQAYALAMLKRYREAVEAFQNAVVLQPDNPQLRAELRFNLAHICDWSDRDTLITEGVSRLQIGELGMTPFESLMLLDDPVLHRQCAEIAARLGASDLKPRPYRLSIEGKIRVGYLSSDFRIHPVSQLMIEVFEGHDRSAFEIVAFCINAPQDSEIHRRLQQAFDEFHYVTDMKPAELSDFMASKNIEIMIDLSGLTDLRRTLALFHRPAPVQVNFLGYPGTLGKDCTDYIIGDPVITPPGSETLYTEKIVRLPHSYLPSSRRPETVLTTRAAHGLPEDGAVFCCFNAPFKITPKIFSAWMRILHATPGSVLWLTASHDGVEANLRREAVAHDVDPARLVFARILEHMSDHLGRLALADIFLDTAPYGAHTTASDALWVGVPVVTSAGASFASRVAASLVAAVGAPELDRSEQGDYEAYAIELAKDPNRLAELKARLLANRDTCPLFDTARFTRDLEAAYAEMSARYRRGESPASFDVPDGG